MKLRTEHIAVLGAAVIGAGGALALLLYLTSGTPPREGAPSPPTTAASASVTPGTASSAAPPASAPAATQHPAAEPVPRIESSDCWFAVPAGRSARCGALVVAERIEDPGSRPLRIRFVVFEGKGAAHADDPVIFISGGPGDPAQIDARLIPHWFSWIGRAEWLAQRDLVVFDQRGVGVSDPKMNCTEMAEAGYRIFPKPLGRAAEAKMWADAAKACFARLAAAGLDLSRYNTKAIVEDLRQLIEQLGYQRWTLFGVSYGTRVAFDFLRAHPGGTRAVILDSVYPPDARFYIDGPKNGHRAFQELFKECAAEASCNTAYPKLGESFERVVRRAAATPLAIQVADPRSGATVEVQLNDAKLVEALFYGLYEWRATQEMPAVIAALDRGDTKPFAPLAAAAFASYASASESHGLFLSVECHDEYPFNGAEEVERAAADVPLFKSFALDTVPLMACPSWPVGKAMPEDRVPAASDLPILIFAGELDPAVSPDWAKHAASQLPHASTVRFPGIGHGVVAAHACADSLIGRFLSDPAKAPYDGCLLALNTALFARPGAPH